MSASVAHTGLHCLSILLIYPGRMAKFAKNDARYWQDRVFFPKYTRDGRQHTSRHYSVRIHFRGERKNFSLYTGSKAAAAAWARDIYMDIYTGLVPKGWQATRDQFKSAEKSKAKSLATVADFFDRIRETSAGEESTLEEYFSAFRLIVTESFGIDGTKQKYDYRTGGRSRWLERVEQVRLDALTPDRVQRWKVAFLKRAGTDPVKVRSARTSVNSLLRKQEVSFPLSDCALSAT